MRGVPQSLSKNQNQAPMKFYIEGLPFAWLAVAEFHKENQRYSSR